MTSAQLTDDIFVQRTDWTVVRPQDEQCILYNSRTDELHILSPSAFHVYSLLTECRLPLHKASKLIADLTGQPLDLVDIKLDEFLHALISRGLVDKQNG